MKIPVIKKLVENHSVNKLKAAEEAIIDEQTAEIVIAGKDEGEQLTHVMAAIWIKEEMANHNDKNFKDTLREYTQKVRTSIS